MRRRILANLLADCELYARRRPWPRIPRRPHSPHPYHQLYLTFYTGMQATALIENYAFAWRMTGDRRWLGRARSWLRAAAGWDHDDAVEEHFYTANRYMQAFALALDLLDGESAGGREARGPRLSRAAPGALVAGCRRPAPLARKAGITPSSTTGTSAWPPSTCWASTPGRRSGCRRSSTASAPPSSPTAAAPSGEPVDGPSFWPWENLWLLQFADALRNVTGIDLTREAPAAAAAAPHLVPRPLGCAPARSPTSSTIPPTPTCSSAPSSTPARPPCCGWPRKRVTREMRDAALADPRLGRLYRFGAGVKGSTAECMIAYGPYAYCYCDPAFRPSRPRRAAPLARRFSARAGRSAVMRSGHGPEAAILCVSGYDGGVAHGFMDLHVQWAGHPVLRTISAAEAQPVSCGSLPCVGGQNEIVGVPGRPESVGPWQRLRVSGRRTEQEYWLRAGEHPILLAALRRRPRGLRIEDAGVPLFRLSRGDAMQYEAGPWFGADGGRLRMRFRLRGRPGGPRVLFNTGHGAGGIGGTGVNTFALVVEADGRLRFTVQSQRNHEVTVDAPGRVSIGAWHEVEIGWGGFNRRAGRPWMETVLDGEARRQDDPATFGEMGRDSQGLASREEPRTFYVRPQTSLAFGGALQTPGVSGACDLAHVDLQLSRAPAAHGGSCPWRGTGDGRRRAGLQAEPGGACAV